MTLGIDLLSVGIGRKPNGGEVACNIEPSDNPGRASHEAPPGVFSWSMVSARKLFGSWDLELRT